VALKKNKPGKRPNPYLRFTSIALQMGLTIYLGSELGKWLDTVYPNKDQLFHKVISLVAIFVAMFSVISQVLKITNKD
jgi:membrane protein DedA with SNARE-associated domain